MILTPELRTIVDAAVREALIQFGHALKATTPRVLITAPDLAARLQCGVPTAASRLQRLYVAGIVKRADHGTYEVVPGEEERLRLRDPIVAAAFGVSS